MATKKSNLTALISQHVQPPQGLKRGQGLVLSTESAPPVATETSATPAEPKRTNRGFTIRTDVIKQLRQIAFEEDRHLYVVVEEALIAYLKKKRRL